MKFEISYSESVEAVNEIGNKKWFASKMKALDVNEDEIPQASEKVKTHVLQTLAQSLAENPMYIPIPLSQKEIKVSESPYSNPESEKAAILAEIFSCKTQTELKEYEFIVKSSNEYQKAYDMMYNKLKSKP